MKYTLFITSPLYSENFPSLKSLANNDLTKSCSEIIVRLADNKLFFYGILVSECSHIENKIRNNFINNPTIIKIDNSRPIILQKEITFDELRGYIKQPQTYISILEVKIYSRGSVNKDFLLDDNISVCDMLRNYFWENYVRKN